MEPNKGMALQGVTRAFNDNVEIFGMWFGEIFVWPDPWMDIWDDGSTVYWEDGWRDAWSTPAADFIPEELDGNQQRT